MKPAAPERTAPISEADRDRQPSSRNQRAMKMTTPTTRDRQILALEIGLRAFRDRAGNLLHARGAGSAAISSLTATDAVHQRQQARTILSADHSSYPSFDRGFEKHRTLRSLRGGSFVLRFVSRMFRQSRAGSNPALGASSPVMKLATFDRDQDHDRTAKKPKLQRQAHEKCGDSDAAAPQTWLNRSRSKARAPPPAPRKTSLAADLADPRDRDAPRPAPRFETPACPGGTAQRIS